MLARVGIDNGMKRFFFIFFAAGALCVTHADVAVSREAIADGLYDVAVRQAEKELVTAKAGTTSARAALKALMEARVAQGRPAEALAAITQHAAIAKAMTADAELAYWKARAELATGDADAAWRTLEGVALSDDRWALACTRLAARVALQRGEGWKRFEALANAAQAADRPAVLLDWAEEAKARGAADELNTAMTRLAQAAPSEAEDVLRYAALLPANGKTLAMLEAARTNAAATVRIPALLLSSALATRGQDATNAVRYARAALAAAEEDGTRGQREEAAHRLGMALLAAPQTVDEGATLIRRFVRDARESPLAPDAQLQMANALLAAGRTDAAFAEYQAFLDAFDAAAPRNEAYAGQGRARFAQGRFAEASRLFQRAADGADATPEWRAEWLARAADATFADGQFAEAARMYRHVYTLFPESELAGEMLLRSADALARAGDAKTALETYERVEDANPELAMEAQTRQCELLAREGELASCVTLADTIISTTKDAALRGRAYLAKGQAHYTAFEFARALRAFDAAAKIDSAADEASYLRVLTLYGMGRDEAAHTAAEAYRTAAAGRFLPEVRLWLIKYAFNTRQFEKAIQLADEYVAAAPQDAWSDAVLLWAARAAMQVDDFTRAVDEIARLRRMFPTSERLPEGAFIQGDALMELGRFQESLLVFDDLITRHPESAWTTRAWLRKGDALYQLGVEQEANYNASIVAYEEALLRYDITPATRFEAEYKIGRGFERTNRMNEAFDQYYAKVVVPFFEQWQADATVVSAAGEWFMRGIFRAAEILDLKNDTDTAVHLLNRVIRLRAPGAAEARERIQRLRQKDK